MFGKRTATDNLEFAESVINTVREPLIALDQDLRVVKVSSSFYDFFKVKPEETVGQLIYDLGNKQWDIPKLRELLEAILPQKATFNNYEVEHEFATIGRRIMLLNARQITRVLGKERIILLAIEDITERKEIEAGLEKTRKELAVIKNIADEASEFAESVINTVREPLIALDQDLRVVKVSSSFYDFFKVKPEETVGQLIYDLGNKQWDIPKLRELLEAILPQKATFNNYEVEHEFATIGRRIMLLNARQIERGMGKKRIILLAIEDITERKQEYLQQMRRLATVVIDSNDAIMLKDFDGQITAWNKGAELMYGYSEEEALKMNIRQITPPDKETEHQEFVRQLIAGEKVTSFETRRVTKDGRIIDVWLTLTKVQDETGKPIGIATTERDITGRKMSENEILKLNNELESTVKQRTAELTAAVKDLDAFSYSVSHDLKAPLRAIAGFANILSEDYASKIDDNGRRLIGVINDNVISMGQLIGDLLKLSHLGKQPMNVADMDVTALVTSVCNDLREELCQNRSMEMSVKPMLSSRSDHTLTKQIFINLISNAVKFTSKKDKALIEIGGYDKGLERVYYVKDNGAGFDMKYMDKLFGVFQRLHTHDEFSGTGIGLAIVSSAVQRHGGRVWAEGEINKGATFYFTLPKGG